MSVEGAPQVMKRGTVSSFVSNAAALSSSIVIPSAPLPSALGIAEAGGAVSR
jgi:hypothetical protein